MVHSKKPFAARERCAWCKALPCSASSHSWRVVFLACTQERDMLQADIDGLGRELQRHEQQQGAWESEIGALQAQYQKVMQK